MKKQDKEIDLVEILQKLGITRTDVFDKAVNPKLRKVFAEVHGEKNPYDVHN
jgi:hypothetical protein